MDRTPPTGVRRQLRKEVGFACPIPECANPYLDYHHFDPPWRDRQHHDPAGMIALCAEHHRKADAGAFTPDQLREYKSRATTSDRGVGGTFDWLRRDILAVLGNGFYFETPILFEVRDQPVIWFNRDPEGYLRLNIRMLTTSAEPRLRLEDNDWILRGNPTDFESPPSGRRIRAKYANGDELSVEFFEVQNPDQLRNRYASAAKHDWSFMSFPITTVEVLNEVGGLPLSFGPTWTKLGGFHLSGALGIRNRVAIHLE